MPSQHFYFSYFYGLFYHLNRIVDCLMQLSKYGEKCPIKLDFYFFGKYVFKFI